MVYRNVRTFLPNEYGFNPTRWKTSCWNGYYCQYDVTDDRLYLRELTILDKNGFYPELNGIACDPPKTAKESAQQDLRAEQAAVFYHYGDWPRQYHDVGMFLPYTGRVLAGAEKTNGFYTHLGYQRAQSYKKLKEFVFKNGVLEDVIDHSHVAALLREGIMQRRAEGIWNMFDEHSLYEQLPKEDQAKLRWFIDRAVPGI